MAHYPDPDAARAGDGAGPFYTHNQPAMNAQAAMELSAHLAREVGSGPSSDNNQTPAHGQDGNSHLEPKFTRPINTAQNYPPHLQQISTPGQFPTEPGNGEESANRKKSKVSRACDECRRKKVCFMAVHQREVDGSMLIRLRSAAMQIQKLPTLQNVQTAHEHKRNASSVAFL